MTSRNPGRPYPDALRPESIRFRTIGLSWTEVDPGKHPIIAKINLLAGQLLEILGPIFWAALILLFFWAELSAR